MISYTAAHVLWRPSVVESLKTGAFEKIFLVLCPLHWWHKLFFTTHCYISLFTFKNGSVKGTGQQLANRVAGLRRVKSYELNIGLWTHRHYCMHLFILHPTYYVENFDWKDRSTNYCSDTITPNYCDWPVWKEHEKNFVQFFSVRFKWQFCRHRLIQSTVSGSRNSDTATYLQNYYNLSRTSRKSDKLHSLFVSIHVNSALQNDKSRGSTCVKAHRIPKSW